MIFCSRFGGYLYTRGAKYETFSVCVLMSRNVVVLFAWTIKNMGLYDFLQLFWVGYMRGGHTRDFKV